MIATTHVQSALGERAAADDLLACAGDVHFSFSHRTYRPQSAARVTSAPLNAS